MRPLQEFQKQIFVERFIYRYREEPPGLAEMPKKQAVTLAFQYDAFISPVQLNSLTSFKAHNLVQLKIFAFDNGIQRDLSPRELFC